MHTNSVTGQTQCFGANLPIARGPRLHLSNYLTGSFNPPPTCNYVNSVATQSALMQVYKNDVLNCCVESAIARIVGLVTGNVGVPYIYSDDQIVQMYEQMAGYAPSNPATDKGSDEQTCLNYWVQHGAPVGLHQIAAWIAVDPTSPAQYRSALYLFENLLFAVNLPDEYKHIGNGFRWLPGTPNPANRHGFSGYSYDQSGIAVCTWGMLGIFTDAAILKEDVREAGGELYCVASMEMIDKASRKAPNGLDWTTLINDLMAFGNPPAQTTITYSGGLTKGSTGTYTVN